MAKDNSIKSKEIIKIILDNGAGKYEHITDKQKDFILNSVPNVIKGLGKASLIKNSQIVGADNKIYKVNYNPSSRFVAFPGFQRQISTILEENSFAYSESITPKQNFLKFIENRGLNYYVHYMFESISQVDWLLIFDKNIEKLHSFYMDNFNFELDDLSSDILSKPDSQTWYIKSNESVIFEIQAPSSKNRLNSHILRVNLKELDKLYKNNKSTNETWGISVEVAICEIYNLPIPSEYLKRFDNQMVVEAKNAIFKYAPLLPKFSECRATQKFGFKKSSTDFMASDISVSVKSNYNGSKKVCPPNIGQPGFVQGLEYFNSVFIEKISIEEIKNGKFLKFKREFQNHISKILSDQVKQLFSEDAILYVRKTKKDISVLFVNTKSKIYNFERSKITFTQTPENWNESVSMSYNGISLAEMQLHSGRSPFKFRFNFENLLKVINEM